MPIEAWGVPRIAGHAPGMLGLLVERADSAVGVDRDHAERSGILEADGQTGDRGVGT